jgi:hypothetical protein
VVRRAVEVFREKVTDEQGNIREAVIWQVPVTRRHPEGVRYRLAFIRAGESALTVLYDNHHPKGHHRHVEEIEEPYNYIDVDRLVADFNADITRIIRTSK